MDVACFLSYSAAKVCFYKYLRVNCKLCCIYLKILWMEQNHSTKSVLKYAIQTLLSVETLWNVPHYTDCFHLNSTLLSDSQWVQCHLLSAISPIPVSSVSKLVVLSFKLPGVCKNFSLIRHDGFTTVDSFMVYFFSLPPHVRNIHQSLQQQFRRFYFDT